ncbi:MAG: hypothetical protein H0W06_06585 [Chloroflexia bacterium]|nr:hypothetical protein [Chloroflexia bacterium]
MTEQRATPKPSPPDDEPDVPGRGVAAPSPLLELPPSPAPGAITADLAADTDDPAILKQRLSRARERLGFYESFDRIIQENIRRSGELMLEAIALREQAQASVVDADERMEREQRLSAREAHVSTLLADLQERIGQARSVLDGLDEQIRSALPDLIGETVPGAAPPAAPEPDLSTTEAAVAAVEEPRVVEVLVHGVPRAAVALSLQRHLGTLAHVVTVEAREFAEGILRLQVTTVRQLGAADLAGWGEGETATVLRADPSVLEVTLPGADGQ